MDRPGATQQRCGEVESALFDLFAHLGATEEQLDFPVLYASAREVHTIHLPHKQMRMHAQCLSCHAGILSVRHH